MNAAAFVGLPWVLSASGPHAFDCWGLCLVAARELYGLELPEIPAQRSCFPGSDALARELLQQPGWKVLEQPQPGAILALLDMRGRLHHVSLCLDNGRLLHTTAALGSRIESLRVVTAVAGRWRLYQWAQ